MQLPEKLHKTMKSNTHMSRSNPADARNCPLGANFVQ